MADTNDNGAGKILTKKKAQLFTLITRDRKMPPFAACVAWNLLDRISSEFAWAWPKIETMAGELSCNEKTVRRAISALEKYGYFEVLRGGHGRGFSNHYRPNLEMVLDVVDETNKGDKIVRLRGTEMSG